MDELSAAGVNKKDHKADQESTHSSTSIVTAAIFALSFLLIGLPLWWKTTTVYRMSLPYSEIEELASLKIYHVIPVTIVFTNSHIEQDKLWEELFVTDLNKALNMGEPGMIIQYDWKLRMAFDEEDTLIRNNNDIKVLDEKLHSDIPIKEIGSITVVVIEEKFKLSGRIPFIGCYRRGYVWSKNDAKSLANDIISLTNTIVQADHLRKLYSPPEFHERKKPEKDKMRSLAATTAFNVAFTLIVPEPQVVIAHWDIERAVEEYIVPFTKKIVPMADVDVKSQIIYMTSLPVQATLRGEHGEFYVTEEQLPSIINPIEGKLGSFTSVNPTLNFVVYIPPIHESPIYILDRKGNLVSTNAFLSPRWGGFLIENFNKTILPLKVEINMANAMGVFLAQLKLLLGLPDVESNSDFEVLRSPETCDWELDFLLRKNTQEQISFAATSLHSLGNLLQTIKNIVICDEVGDSIYYAVDAIKDCLYYLEQGVLKEGSVKAREAFNASETAFFDPSLLALLYFPEDQKYAIYIPLFLPISIPVILSLQQIWLYWKQTSRKQKTE